MLTVTPPTPAQWQAAFKQPYDAMVKAAQESLDATAKDIVTKGRQNIAASGFSARWQRGLTATVTKGAGINGSIHAFHRIGYATVFETGATIVGKPLLWLPLPNVPTGIGGRPMTPKAFVREIGPLFSIRSPHGGPPLLGAMMQGTKDSRITVPKLRRGAALTRLGVRGRGGQSKASKGLVSVPVFYGLTSVTVRKHWNVEQVYEDAQKNIAADFVRRLGV